MRRVILLIENKVRLRNFQATIILRESARKIGNVNLKNQNTGIVRVRSVDLNSRRGPIGNDSRGFLDCVWHCSLSIS